MPVKIVKINSDTLPAIADAIRAKTGSTGSILPSQMAGKIANIPTCGELPVLSSPAEVNHVVAGKEYIDAAGNKQTGTMVVCDSVQVVETLGAAGIGLQVEIESTVDASTRQLALPEPNISADNIKSGVNIYGIVGNAKTIRVETGTITPEGDITTVTIPCSAGFKYAVICATSQNFNNGDILGAIINNSGRTELFRANCFLSYYYLDKIGLSATVATTDSGIIIHELESNLFYRAGVNYEWNAYYWEENQ